MWDPPGSRIEPVSPALTGGFFTSEPPQESPFHLLLRLEGEKKCQWMEVWTRGKPRLFRDENSLIIFCEDSFVCKNFLSFFLFLMPSLLLEFSFRNFCAIFPEFYMRYIFISSNSQWQSVSSTEQLCATAQEYFYCCRILITSPQILVQCHSWIHN